MCYDTFCFPTATNSFKEKNSLMWTSLLAVIRGLQQWLWLTASVVRLYYKTRLFFELLSSSRPLSSQSEFLFVWELAHHS